MEVTIDIDDIIFSSSKLEKRELYQALIEDGDFLSDKEQRQREREEQERKDFMLMDALQAMRPYQLKQMLCNLLNVPTYTDEQGLRLALEPIIKA